jgi:polysaccharide pyruvyl transferase WcaK-like protein
MTPGNKPIIAIMGASMATRNRGVSALGASLTKLLDEAAPSAEVVMLIPNRNALPFHVFVRGVQRTVRVVNCRQSPKSRPSENIFIIAVLAMAYRLLPLRGWRRAICRVCPWIRTVAEAALVGDIRGGDSFSDIYGLKSFVLASIPTITVLWIRGSIVLFPQTYGPYRHRLAKLIARYILRRANPILSRDRESMDTVREVAGPEANMRFCPDVAFALDPMRPSTVSITPPIPTGDRCFLVGLNVNGLMYNGGYTRQNMFGLKMDYREFLKLLVDAILDDGSVRVLLVPHTFAPIGDVQSDPEACRLVMETVVGHKRGRVHLVDREYDQHETKSVIGGCDFFIGSRLHSCIAALSQGIPTVGVAYSKKFKGVFESVGAGDWIMDGCDMDAAMAVTGVLSRIRQHSAMRAALTEENVRVRTLLRETFSSFLVPKGS